MTMLRATALVATGVLAGCAGGGAGDEEGRASTAASDQASVPAVSGQADWFVDRAGEAGLVFEHVNGMSGEYYFPEMIPAGVAWLDYDNDDDLDAYFVQGRMLGDAATIGQDVLARLGSMPLSGRLYRNDLHVAPDGTRTLRFTDVTEQSGLDARGYGMGVATGDIDNDGWVDLYLINFGANRLYRNAGDGTFVDISPASGTADPGWGVSASFLDYDRDGWLDLYVGNYVQYSVEADRPCTGLTGRRDYCTPKVYTPQPDRLYRNQGGGRFVDVTATALVGGTFGPALGVSTADFDGDGWLDVYVANDGRENLLWMNQQDGTLASMGRLSGSALSTDGRPEASMGVDAGDFDNDGDEDLFVTHLPAEGNNLYVNLGTGLFEDKSAASGLGPSSLGSTGFGTAWFDYDNDGWLDILVVNGAIEAAKGLDEPFPYGEPNRLFRNLGNGRFADVTAQAGAVFTLSDVSRGAAFGDVDNDGDVDVLVGTLNGRARLLVNNIGNRQHWLGLKLVGARAAHEAPGAWVEVVRRDGMTLTRRGRADGSYASANDPRVLVGLGESADAPDVRVHWLAGGVEEWSDVAVDRWMTLREGDGAAR